MTYSVFTGMPLAGPGPFIFITPPLNLLPPPTAQVEMDYPVLDASGDVFFDAPFYLESTPAEVAAHPYFGQKGYAAIIDPPQNAVTGNIGDQSATREQLTEPSPADRKQIIEPDPLPHQVPIGDSVHPVDVLVAASIPPITIKPELEIWDTLLKRVEALRVAYAHNGLGSIEKFGMLKQGNQLAVSFLQQILKFLATQKSAPRSADIQEVMKLAGNIIQKLHYFLKDVEKDVSVTPIIRTLFGGLTNSYLRFLVDMELLTILEDDPEAFLDPQIMSRIEALAQQKSIFIPGVNVNRWHVEIANIVISYFDHTFHLETVKRVFTDGKIIITGESRPNVSHPSNPFIIRFFEKMLGWKSKTITNPDGTTTVEIQI
ncbi:MAG: hypothetical protein ACD_73C00158G0001 [uncultured bacterium]|nr:MAG: hypothetical protein ACD_73C00158G0001 [uncultured bacterium]